MIKLYTRTICPKCMMVKNQMEMNNIEYITVNLDNDLAAKTMMQDKGVMAVPVMEVNGELLITVPEIMSKLEELSE